MKALYKTEMGQLYNSSVEDFIASRKSDKYRGNVQLILTSPPFPLNRKKDYGNYEGDKYLTWLEKIAVNLKPFLTPNGSLVVEIGNSWDKGDPTMSTLSIESLLAIKRAGRYNLCQQFVAYNPARLPSPIEWVNVQRIRVKDSFTHIWWMSSTPRPYAKNTEVLKPYSPAMQRLLKTGKYNAGKRPSEYDISPTAFLKNHGGAIPPNVLTVSNTATNDPYQEYCRLHDIRIHPARMPKEIPDFFIRMLTRPGDLVWDPFAGSNTTGSVAEKLDRRWLATEKDEEYAILSRTRFQSRPRKPNRIFKKPL